MQHSRGTLRLDAGRAGGRLHSWRRAHRKALPADPVAPSPSPLRSLNPDVGYCIPCSAATRANCTGVAPIPLDGYWVSSARSPVVHRCLVDAACHKANKTAAGDMYNWALRYRDVGTKALLTQQTPNGTPLYMEYQDALCSPGYTVQRGGAGMVVRVGVGVGCCACWSARA